MVNILVENFDFEAQYVASQEEVRRRSADVKRLLEEKRDISILCARLEKYKAAFQHKDFPWWLWARAENIPFGKDGRTNWEQLPATAKRRWERIAKAADICARFEQEGRVIYSDSK